MGCLVRLLDHEMLCDLGDSFVVELEPLAIAFCDAPIVPGVRAKTLLVHRHCAQLVACFAAAIFCCPELHLLAETADGRSDGITSLRVIIVAKLDDHPLSSFGNLTVLSHGFVTTLRAFETLQEVGL